MDKNDIVLKNVKILGNLRQTNSVASLLKDLKSPEKVDKLLLILLDTSGSMAEGMGSSSKISVAWKVFHKNLLPNMAGWSYGIISFGNTAQWESHPTSNTTALTPRTPHAAGMTALGQALKIAWDWAKTYSKEARFIVLSDGRPNDMNPDDIVGMVRECRYVPIDTVGIGNSSSSSYDPEFLQTISHITGGTFSEVNSVQMLADTIKKLSPAERPLLGNPNKEVL